MCLPLTIKNIEEQHNKVLKSINYGKEYLLINDIIKSIPLNDDIQKIALKIALIDTTNSTNINKYKEKVSLYDLALNIKSIENFDIRVKNGDLTLVSELAFKNQKINLFSFATKYCCYHNVCAYDNDDYFIFDNILKKHLHLYIPTATKNKLENLRSHRDYETYHRLLSDYLLENNINCEFKRRKFDHFVWNQFRKNS